MHALTIAGLVVGAVLGCLLAMAEGFRLGYAAGRTHADEADVARLALQRRLLSRAQTVSPAHPLTTS